MTEWLILFNRSNAADRTTAYRMIRKFRTANADTGAIP
jgi:hypothetical protein